MSIYVAYICVNGAKIRTLHNFLAWSTEEKASGRPSRKWARDQRLSQTHANVNEDAEMKTSERGMTVSPFFRSLFVACFVEPASLEHFLLPADVCSTQD